MQNNIKVRNFKSFNLFIEEKKEFKKNEEGKNNKKDETLYVIVAFEKKPRVLIVESD